MFQYNIIRYLFSFTLSLMIKFILNDFLNTNFGFNKISVIIQYIGINFDACILLVIFVGVIKFFGSFSESLYNFCLVYIWYWNKLLLK